MIYQVIIIGLSFVFLGGFAVKAGSSVLGLVMAGLGATLLGLLFATQERLLREATSAVTQREESDDSE